MFTRTGTFIKTGTFTGNVYSGRDVAPRPPFRAPLTPSRTAPARLQRGGGREEGRGRRARPSPRARAGAGARTGAGRRARMRGAAYK